MKVYFENPALIGINHDKSENYMGRQELGAVLSPRTTLRLGGSPLRLQG